MKKFIIAKYILIATWIATTAAFALEIGEISIYISAIAFACGVFFVLDQMKIDQEKRNKAWHRE